MAKFVPAIAEIPDAQRLTLQGVELVAFSDGMRAHTMLAELFDLLFKPEVVDADFDENEEPPPAVKRAMKRMAQPARKPRKDKGQPRKRAQVESGPPIPAAAQMPKPNGRVLDVTNEQIIEALERKPMEYTELLEHFRVEGQKPVGAFYARLHYLKGRGDIIAPPPGSGGAWRAK